MTGGAATMTLSYQGRTFPICCTGCRDEFNENPEKYLKKASLMAHRQPAKPNPASQQPRASAALRTRSPTTSPIPERPPSRRLPGRTQPPTKAESTADSSPADSKVDLENQPSRNAASAPSRPTGRPRCSNSVKTSNSPANTPLYGEATLTVHEQSPIIDGNDTYMVMKMGTYNSCNPAGNWVNGDACGPNSWNTMEWCEVRFSWVNGVLAQAWSFDSDWVPEPNATSPGFGGLQGWEPVFHPVDANNFIYVPGAGGTVWKVNKTTGASASHINPFQGNANVIVANTYVAGPLTADANGNIYYNVIQLNTDGNPWNQNDVVNGWLVKIASDDTSTVATFASLVPGAPAGSADTCPESFYFENPQPSFPWPPSPTAIPPTGPCGSQRPGINVAPAVSADGSTIYTVSRAHFDNFVSYLVAVNTADLTPKWQASLQNRLNDGCGVLLPIAALGVTTEANSCTFGTTVGVDPTTNAFGSGYVIDQASSSPTVLPDGSIVFGALDNYNFSRGHLFRFSAQGSYVGAYAFGWDSTPGVWAHDGTFSILIKDNHYGSSSYCSVQNNPVCASTPQVYYITQLDANLNIEWQFQSTTIDADHPNGYEWCINMPAIDMLGNVYVNSEDGNIYELPQGNTGIFTMPAGKMFLDIALGAAYTPLSIGPDGKLYTQNNGQFFVVGN